MSFDQHYSFIQEGIITFEEQCKRLNEIKKEKEKEKEKEKDKEIIEAEKKEFENEEDYDIVLDDIKKENFDLILNNEEINNYNYNIYNNKNKVKNQCINAEGNNEKSSDKEDEGKGRKPKGGRRKILGRKRNSVSNSVKNYLMIDLEYSIDDFIYNKRDFRINGYDSFFLNIQSKISRNVLNTHGLNVSLYYKFNL